MRAYRALAPVYDRLVTADYEAMADYLLGLFSRFGSPPATLLDLACGSGRLMAALERRGIDVIGVDISPDMLALARCRTKALLLCQDMRELDLLDTVDGAVCTMDAFNHLLTAKDVLSALSRLSLFICPGGLLIFDVNTPYKHREVLGGRSFVLEEKDLLCAWQNSPATKNGTVHMRLDFFERQPGGLYRRSADEITERAFSLMTWKKWLAASRFTPLLMTEPFRDTPPSPTAERIVVIARNDRPAEEFV